MNYIKCPVCEHKIDLPNKIKVNDRLTCPNCFAQLAFKNIKGKNVLRCSICPSDHIECSSDCERRISHQKHMDLL